MKIAWLTDLHLVLPGAPIPTGVDPVARLQACLDDIRAHHADADLLVVSGDLIQRANHGAYVLLRDRLEGMPMPARLLLGNHDDRQAFFSAFPDAPQAEGFAQFAEAAGGARLVYLDTVAQGHGHGELCDVRLAWLRRTLAQAHGGPTLVFMHHPPFDVGIPALDALKLREGERLAAVLGEGGVAHILCGHLHRCVSGVWHGMPFSVMKSPHVPFALDMAGVALARSDEAPGYGIVLVEPGRIVVHLRDLGRSVP